MTYTNGFRCAGGILHCMGPNTTWGLYVPEAVITCVSSANTMMPVVAYIRLAASAKAMPLSSGDTGTR